MENRWAERQNWASARKKAWEAVNVLLGSEPIEKRLAHANVYLGHLQADSVLQDTMPETAIALFLDIMKTMDEHRLDGRVDYGTIELDPCRANLLAEDVFSLYTLLNDGI